jgi:hypothetical protein
MQGRYITHQALPAFGARERITMVTSFRPKSPYIKDGSVLNTVRPISNLSALYGQWLAYRMENLEMRARAHRKDIMARLTGERKLDIAQIKQINQSLIKFLMDTDNELVHESEVAHGHIEESNGGNNLKARKLRPLKRPRL